MAVGYPVTKAGVDAQAMQLVLDLRNTLEQIAKMKVWLDGQSEADLIALGYTGGEGGEVALLKSSFTDLANLHKVAIGQQSQAEANDFLFFARRLLAFN